MIRAPEAAEEEAETAAEEAAEEAETEEAAEETEDSLLPEMTDQLEEAWGQLPVLANAEEVAAEAEEAETEVEAEAECLPALPMLGEVHFCRPGLFVCLHLQQLHLQSTLRS